ncbi:MAG: succinate dehydrogenase cytochrome b subunit [Acidobacteria bacterium]|nr:succinate dehydrogenase cytochrome b subunit [Acidobacteriota bacterium]
MSSIAMNGGLSRPAGFYQSVVGTKVVMAATGFVLCGFVLGHMIGNLQVFQGPEKLNHYAEMLQGLGGALWGVRAVLLLCTGLHIISAYQLWRLKGEARPQAYVKKATIATSYAARTMLWSGPIIGAFLVYHILHFTTGQALGSDFVKGDVYHNVILGFRNPAASLFYMVANILLAMHLYHGVWSMFQTMGVNHPQHTPKLKALAKIYGWAIGIGNVSMPLAVLTGLIGGAVK